MNALLQDTVAHVNGVSLHARGEVLEAEALRRQAEDLEGAAPDTVRFTRAIKAAVSSIR